MADQFSGTIMRRILVRSGDLASGASTSELINLPTSRPHALVKVQLPIPTGGIITSTDWAPAAGIRSLDRTIGRLVVTRSYQEPGHVLFDVRGNGKRGQGAILLYAGVLSGDARPASGASVNLNPQFRFNLLTDGGVDTTFTLEDATADTVGVEYFFRVTTNKVTIMVASASQDKILIRPDRRRGRRTLVNSINSNSPGDTVVLACRRENQWVVENPSSGFLPP